jgi:hypothetical protein
VVKLSLEIPPVVRAVLADRAPAVPIKPNTTEENKNGSSVFSVKIPAFGVCECAKHAHTPQMRHLFTVESVMSSTTIIIIIVFVVLIVLISITAGITIPLWSMRKNKKKVEALMATGRQGEATILQLEDTGTRINDNPRMNVFLEVHIPGYPPYQVRKTVTIPLRRVELIHIGSVVSVLADPSQPANPDKVGILLK